MTVSRRLRQRVDGEDVQVVRTLHIGDTDGGYRWRATCRECGEWQAGHVHTNETVQCDDCGAALRVLLLEEVKPCAACGRLHSKHDPPVCFSCAVGRS